MAKLGSVSSTDQLRDTVMTDPVILEIFTDYV
jgi:hypothetical protein